MRIYVAEDEPITAKLIAATLTSAGHDVSIFPDGLEAFAAYEADPVPLVVTDWLMPHMTGVELCRKIRRASGTIYTNVIIVTALSFDEHVADAFRAGADDMIAKPFDPALLLGRVKACERGQLAQADEALRKCLEICQEALGPEHQGLLDALEALADVSRRQRSYVRCRAFVRRQLAIAERTLGRDDARTVKLARELEELDVFEERL